MLMFCLDETTFYLQRPACTSWQNYFDHEELEQVHNQLWVLILIGSPPEWEKRKGSVRDDVGSLVQGPRKRAYIWIFLSM